MRLEYKTVLITGSSSGIGEAIAELFHKKGATVILSDIKDEEGQNLKARLGECSDYLHLDVKEKVDWIHATEYIQGNYGKLDIMVNNAGITGFLETSGPFDAENVDLESWEEVHKVHSTGVMLGCKYAIKMMKDSGGSIVNISSRSGMVGIPLGHFGEPINVAFGALYLASDESKYVTGIELTIDGGILAGSQASPPKR